MYILSKQKQKIDDIGCHFFFASLSLTRLLLLSLTAVLPVSLGR